MSPIDARLFNLEDATIDDLYEEIENLRRELAIAERKAQRWKEAFDEVERICKGLIRSKYNED